MVNPKKKTAVIICCFLCIFLPDSTLCQQNGNGNFEDGLENLFNLMRRMRNDTATTDRQLLIKSLRKTLGIDGYVRERIAGEGNATTSYPWSMLSFFQPQSQSNPFLNSTSMRAMLNYLTQDSTANLVEEAMKQARAFMQEQLQSQDPKTQLQLIDAITALTSVDLSFLKTYVGIQQLIQASVQQVFEKVSAKCLNATSYIGDGLGKGKTWAMSLVDAMGKPESGILQGKMVWLGSYTECVDITTDVIKAEVGVNETDVYPFNGQYCMSTTPMGYSAGMPLSLKVGLCMPDVCTRNETTILIKTAHQLVSTIVSQMQGANATEVATTVDCQPPYVRPFDDKAKVALGIIGFFVLLVIVGTTFDVVTRMLRKNEGDEDVKTTHGVVVDRTIMEGKVNDISKEVIDPDNVELAHVKADEATVAGNDYGDLQLPVKMVLTGSLDGRSNGNISHANSTAYLVTNEANEKKEEKKDEQGVCAKLLLSFSAYTSGMKILGTNQPAGSLECLHGIRFLSMAWVILGHTISLTPFMDGYIGNMLGVYKYMRNWSFLAISNATVSVDTFFVLSGLLVTYLALKAMKKKDGFGVMDWALFYFHRYWRLTPPYMLILMIHMCLLPYMSTGPFWNYKGDLFCQNYNWWTNLLYVNNIVNPNEQCMGWGWYLANDMQFYVFSPLLLYPMFKAPKIGVAITSVLAMASVVLRGVLSHENAIGPAGSMAPVEGGTLSLNFWEILYVKPWTRVGAYLVGVLVGYTLYRTKCKVNMHWALALLGWVVAAFCCCSVLYGIYEPIQGNLWSNDVSAVYNALWRSGWSIGVGWVAFACCTGYGGWVNQLLSWRGFVPLGRLTYCAYLIHPVIMELFYRSHETLIMMTMVNFIFYFLAFLLASYAVAFVLSLLFEAPMLGVEKALLGKLKR